jgi:phage FluMu gp28-like protein
MALIQLTQYQKEAAGWTARFDLRRWSRQSGKTFEDMREVVDDSFARRTAWVILSRGERQSKKNMEQARIHCEAYGAAAEVLEDTWEGEDAKYKSLEIRLPNKSSILGLPANPDTARGFSANVSLDEFAFHKDSRKIWAALFPVITRGYRLKVTSTPFGKQNKFYDLDVLWSKKQAEGDPHYHTSKLDIYDAVAGGLQLRDEEGNLATPEQLKEALGDDEAWDQEYLVLYVDEATAFLPYDLIAKCEDAEIEPEPVWVGLLLAEALEMHQIYLATKILPPSFEVLDPTLINGESFYLGFDIARRRHGSVIWVNRDRQGIQETVAVIRMKNVPFFIQKVVLFSLLAHPQMRRGCIDQTGIGGQLAEEAIDRFGDGLVEGIDFTIGNKELLATGMKQKMEDGIPRIPAEPHIRNSLHAVKKLATGTGHFRFDAEATDKLGHADEFWAEALALHAYAPFGEVAGEPRIRAIRPQSPWGAIAGVGVANG